jgi:hypothetical protein
MDRERQADGTCIAITGCNTFFANQNAGNIAWTNAGRSSFHGGQLTLRRAVSSGWGFDLTTPCRTRLISPRQPNPLPV